MLNPHIPEHPSFRLVAGRLAIWRTVSSGEVPCKVVRVEAPEPRSGMVWAHIRINADRGPYKKGEIVRTSASFIRAR